MPEREKRGTSNGGDARSAPGRMEHCAPFDEDPDLLDQLAPDTADHLRTEISTPVELVPKGMWQPQTAETRPQLVGYLVLDGVLSREVLLLERRGVELLGRGDLFIPGSTGEWSSVPQRAELRVIQAARLALIDRDLLAAIARYPEVLERLIGRAVQRSCSATMQLAISQLPNASSRVLVLFWHLADRWGQWKGGKIQVPVDLPQALIGDLISLQRQTVNAAMAELADDGRLRKESSGGWILTGEPPNEIGDLKLSGRRDVEMEREEPATS